LPKENVSCEADNIRVYDVIDVYETLKDRPNSLKKVIEYVIIDSMPRGVLEVFS